MTRVAFASYAELPAGLPDELRVHALLRDLGCTVDTPDWADTRIQWSSYDLVVLRSTWDYTARRDEYVEWARRVATQTTLRNDAEVVAWNTDKRYLRDLASRGVAVVPTDWAPQGSHVDLAQLARQRGWRDVVVKPAVDAGARRALRGPADSDELQQHTVALAQRGEVMVQPYVPSVDGYGERALVFINGTLSHAVRKRAHLGAERLGPEEWPPPDVVAVADDERAAAQAVLAAACDALGGPDLLYARVDLVRGPNGEAWLGELELTEPYLFLTAAPDEAPARLAAAVLARLG